MRSLLAPLIFILTLILSQVCDAQDRPATIVGAAIRSRPAYDGSSSQVTDLIPQLRYYGKLWFARTTQGILEGGIRNELAPEFWAGAQIAYEGGRQQEERGGVPREARRARHQDERFGPPTPGMGPPLRQDAGQLPHPCPPELRYRSRRPGRSADQLRRLRALGAARRGVRPVDLGIRERDAIALRHGQIRARLPERRLPRRIRRDAPLADRRQLRNPQALRRGRGQRRRRAH